MNLRASTHRPRFGVSLIAGLLVGTVFTSSAIASDPPTAITTRDALIAISGSDSYILDFLNPSDSDFSFLSPSSPVSYISNFAGTLDGNGLTLTGLSVALFDSLGNGAVIKNLGLATTNYTPVVGDTPASGGITTSGSGSTTSGSCS